MDNKTDSITSEYYIHVPCSNARLINDENDIDIRIVSIINVNQ